MWSKKYDKCIKCGTIKIPHEGRGFCKQCYKVPEENCSKCGELREVEVRDDKGMAICKRCYRQPIEICSICRRLKIVIKRDNHNKPICPSCYVNYAPKETCSLCGELRRVVKRDRQGTPICIKCYQKSYRYVNKPKEICVICGEFKIVKKLRNKKTICNGCFEKSRIGTVTTCGRCGQIREIAGRNEEGKPVCSDCLRYLKRPEAICNLCGTLAKVKKKSKNGGAICDGCFEKNRKGQKAICSKCGRLLTIEKHDDSGRPICRQCAEVREVCNICGNFRKVGKRNENGYIICNICHRIISEYGSISKYRESMKDKIAIDDIVYFSKEESFIANIFNTMGIKYERCEKKFRNPKFNVGYIPDFIVDDNIIVEYFGLYYKECKKDFLKVLNYSERVKRKIEFYGTLSDYKFFAIFPEDLYAGTIIDSLNKFRSMENYKIYYEYLCKHLSNPPLENNDTQISEKMKEVIEIAIKKKVVIEVDYMPQPDRNTPFVINQKVEPYLICPLQNEAKKEYLVGVYQGECKIRTLNLKRFIKINLTDLPFNIPSSFKFFPYVDNYFEFPDES